LLTIAARLARNARRAVDTLEEGQMLTIIILILLALVVLVIAGWWLFEIELPDVVVAGTAPAGACIVYFYGTLLSWIIGGGPVPRRRRLPDLQVDAHFEVRL
jgi:hypothetical protein